MKKLTCTFILSAVALQFAAAADATSTAATTALPSKAAASDGSKPAPATLELKNKSGFVLDETGRNPFWPIGWKPAAKLTAATGAEQTPSAPDVSPNAFLVSSITLGSTSRFAIINGKPMTEGQVFGLQMGGATYQITVKSIEDGRVILLRRDQEIEVPLRRR